MTKVKICGITNLEDAQISVKFGADALGFNFYKKSPRFIEAEKVREIVEQLKGEILKVGVFVNESLENIAEIAETAKLDAIQLHGEETPEFCREIKLKTNLEVIKAFRVSPAFTPEDVLKYEVDAILLDAYNPKEHGGTGETFDWEIAKKVQKICPKMYLAGGLSDENISWAVKETKPYSVDVCSGIESNKGKKYKIKLVNFVTKAKNTLQEIQINNVYDLLAIIQLRPALYLGKCNISFLRVYLEAIQFSSMLFQKEFEFKKFLKKPEVNFNSDNYFTGFVARYFNQTVGAMGWNSIILEECNNDEEKAFDLFFAVLEEFKLEKEDLNNL